jgi:hypothetical protein
MAENSNKIAIKTMASRIIVVNVIKDLKTSSENLKTKKKYNFFGVIKEWAALKHIGEDVDIYEVQELDN